VQVGVPFYFTNAQRVAVNPIKIEYLIPAFHAMAHNPNCQSRFRAAYRRFTGRIDAENSERSWRGSNGRVASMKEMSKGRMCVELLLNVDVNQNAAGRTR
jgi:hypothetical protein